ncbi:hypothetical protein [Pseudomonas japonica]|uniref:hypothetical protein n=1 Tax=Pseudomonas japonica TaxID=256466 RepID=UPI0015E2A4C3|nr:hypothetical protein [Pseudomonas japonica]MBA1290052.1 hypothetical protein [Pseudomonas japonica]
MSIHRAESNADSLTGKMTAAVQVRDGQLQSFKTSAHSYLEDTRLHVYGIDEVSAGRTDLIYLWIPREIKNGTYPIQNTNSEAVVRATFTYEGVTPFVTSGKISIEWDRAANQFKAEFEMQATTDGRAYKVRDGAVDVAVLTTAKRSGNISASITPPLLGGDSSFLADEWRFEPGSDNWTLLATQKVGDSTQGILLRIPDNYEGGHPAKDWAAFFVYNHGIYIGRGLDVSDFTWDKAQKRLEGNVSFETDIAGRVHKVKDARIAIKY